MNQALLAKWSWQLISGHNSLCGNVLKAKYLRGTKFQDAVPNNGDSWFWKLIIKARHLANQVAYKAIGHGRSINIWEDPWVPLFPGFKPILVGVPRQGYMYAADVITVKGQWNIQKLRECFEPTAVEAICKIDLGNGIRLDTWIWTKNANGLFSTKSTYLIQAHARAPSISVLSLKEWSKLWNSKIYDLHKTL